MKLGLFLGGLLVLVVMMMVSINHGTPKLVALPDLEATVKASGLQLELTNRDDREWVNIDISVNTDPQGSGGYHAHADQLNPGATTVINLVNFVDDTGNRYQPLIKAVINARVDAATQRVVGKRQTYFCTFGR